MSATEGPILYVLVVGFHHKKGCQVEYSFPPLVPEAPNECPPGWKYLPTLALPDGSHNYDEDTVYFHLPSLTNAKKTIFGISCFRQIPVEKIKNRTSDMTRGTVQKSVCVLSKIPLYGQIQVKMSLITHAYFDEGDFCKVSILEDTYHHLNSVLLENDLRQQTFVGLSARDFVLQWKHKALLLFKLLLLERRVIFYKSPVHPLCGTILTLISLFPEMLERGLDQSACIRLSRPMSPMPDYPDDSSLSSPVKAPDENKSMLIMQHYDDEKSDPMKNVSEENLAGLNAAIIGIEIAAEEEEEGHVPNNNNSSDTMQDNLENNLNYLTHLSTACCGFPLAIFTKGYLCLPYLSLPYLDLLTDLNVRGYLIGATNILFKQKNQLYDILVDIDTNRIECQDLELRKCLHLTTQDLRFADYIVKRVSEERQDVFLDGVGWEGGDEWIRTQFRIYLLCLLRTSLLQESANDHFNSGFINCWRETHNYKIWQSGINPGILDVNSGHPFAGQLSVADMKLRLAHTIQNSDSGRKINQAMVSTGRAMATTSKAVGGAFNQAKGALTNWWSNLLPSPELTMQQQSTSDGLNFLENNQTSDIPKDNCVNGNLNDKDDDGHELGQIYTV